MEAIPEQAWLRERLEELERIERPSASEGERRAAEWLSESFTELGARARIEAAPAHGTYWWPLGLGASIGALGGLAALRGRRRWGALIGGIAAAAIFDDFPPPGADCAVCSPSAAPITSLPRSARTPSRRPSSSSPTTTPRIRASSFTRRCHGSPTGWG